VRIIELAKKAIIRVEHRFEVGRSSLKEQQAASGTHYSSGEQVLY